MLGCQCQQNTQQDPGVVQLYQGVQLLPPEMSDSSLAFFIKGVQVGMSIRASEMQKFTRLGVILAIGFGVLTFLNRMER